MSNYAFVSLGDSEVSVSFDYDLGEPERWNGLTGVGNPEVPAYLELTSVLINGVWVGTEVFAEDWIARTEQHLLDIASEYLP